MAPNHGYEKEMAVLSIRQCAQEMVGPCTDSQILFVAVTMGKCRVADSLLDLDEGEVEDLNIFMVDQLNRYRLEKTFGMRVPKW